MGTFLTKKKKMKYACLVAVVAVLLTAECAFGQTFGIDVSMSVSESQFASGHRNGNFSFAIPRAWHSYGAADTEAPDNVRNARAAGYARVDVYAFVCPGGGGASSQIDGLVKFIRDNRMEIDYDGSLSCQSEPFPGCHPSFKQFNDHDSFCAD